MFWYSMTHGNALPAYYRQIDGQKAGPFDEAGAYTWISGAGMHGISYSHQGFRVFF